MNETFLCSLISGAVTLIGVFVSAKTGGDKLSREMDKKIAVIETKMDDMESKIETHNGYARMFSENIPAIKQHLGEIDRRLENAERKM